MKRLPLALTAAVLALAAAIMPSPSLAAATSRCGRSWRIVPSPSPAAGSNELDAVAALARDDVWAVGWQSREVAGRTKTLIEHWNGTAWTVTPSPNVKRDSNVLLGVAATSPTDVWAVGLHYQPAQTRQTLIEHWDGSRWTIVASPSPGTAFSILDAVTAVSVNDVWAVGSVGYVDQTGVRTLIEHWDGQQWTAVPSPSPAGEIAELRGATTVSATEVWAVGDYSPDGQLTLTLTERWDGTNWTVVPSENRDPIQNYLYGVDAASRGSLWAAGFAGSSALIEQGNGSSWSVIASPSRGALSSLRGVVALGPANAWVVGFWQDANGDEHTLTEHWNGRRWVYVDSPDSALPDNDLLAASAAGGVIWAVGHAFTPGPNPSSTLVERICPD
jgi:hypothetical protein